MPSDGSSEGRRLGRVEVRQLIEEVVSGGGCVLYERGDGTFEVGTPAQDGSWRTVALRHADGTPRQTFTRAELLDYVRGHRARRSRPASGPRVVAGRLCGPDQGRIQ